MTFWKSVLTQGSSGEPALGCELQARGLPSALSPLVNRAQPWLTHWRMNGWISGQVGGPEMGRRVDG